MAKRKRTDEPEDVHVTLPKQLMEKVRARLYDPVRNRTRYGALNGLIESKLREWLREQGDKSV